MRNLFEKFMLMVFIVVILIGAIFQPFGTKSRAKADEPSSIVFIAHVSDSTRYQIDTNRLDMIPYNWNKQPFLPENALYLRIGFPVEGGYVIYSAHLLAWIHNSCGVYPEFCIYTNQERIYDTRGTLSFMTTYPKYYTMLPYDNVILRVYQGDTYPVTLRCTTEVETFKTCLSRAQRTNNKAKAK